MLSKWPRTFGTLRVAFPWNCSTYDDTLFGLHSVGVKAKRDVWQIWVVVCFWFSSKTSIFPQAVQLYFSSSLLATSWNINLPRSRLCNWSPVKYWLENFLHPKILGNSSHKNNLIFYRWEKVENFDIFENLCLLIISHESLYRVTKTIWWKMWKIYPISTQI